MFGGKKKEESKKDKYSLGNSRSPMMFRKRKDKKLSRSLDDLLVSSFDNDEPAAGDVQWPEIASVKKVGPVVMCILPPFSADFVCSALHSLGATPLVTDGERECIYIYIYMCVCVIDFGSSDAGLATD